ncbi:MAG: DUF460 domain-containing protein [Ignisphaera sp.]
MLALGLDIVKGNPLSRTSPPIYAVVIVDDNGKIVAETSEAPLNTVIRLTWDYSINRLGIDNIYELAPTSKDIARILALLPSHTEVYQVTIDNNTFVNLVSQASKIGITLASKPRPLQTAYICALLALNGVGVLVKGLERKTRIIVSRARSTGSGGSSTNRYVRGMRTAVLRAVREIKALLEKEKIDYDIIIRKSLGGFDSAVFTAYVDSQTIRKLIKPYKGNDIRIIIKPVYTDIIVINNNENDIKKRPLIVGIDPGIETGLAIIDLSLNILTVESLKGLDRLDIINKIYQHGIPILIAVDKNPPPESAKKLASMLGVQLYVPNESLDTETKEKLIEWLKKRKHINIKITTTHERDALVSALKAYKAYEKKLIELEKKLLEIDLDIDIDEMKSLLLKGYSVSHVLEYAINKYLSNMMDKELVYHNHEHEKSIEACNNLIQGLESKVYELIKENEMLRQKLREVENKMENMIFEKRFNKVEQIDYELTRDREIVKLNEQIRQLQLATENLRNEVNKLVTERNRYIELLSAVMMRKVIIVPWIKSLTIHNIHSIKDYIAVSKIIVVDGNYISYDILNYLKQLKVIPIFEKCQKDVEQVFIAEGIPILCGLNINKLDDRLAIININELEESLINAIIRLRSVKKTNSNITLEDLMRIISEYRSNVR